MLALTLLLCTEVGHTLAAAARVPRVQLFQLPNAP